MSGRFTINPSSVLKGKQKGISMEASEIEVCSKRKEEGGIKMGLIVFLKSLKE